MPNDTVLVTGGSGYIAGWCIARLLQDGYFVRTTVRSLAREAEVRRTLATIAPNVERVAFVAADLERDEGWTEAAQGCRYVLHVASPLGLDAPHDPQVLIRPARDGALRALRAAAEAGAERVVMTSSVAAVASGTREGSFDETRWTDPEAKGVSAYAQSKTYAERAAWEFIQNTASRTSLTTIQPVVVVGPVTSADYSGSVQAVSRLLSGATPGIPNLGFGFVDVRDVADLHLKAMLAPEAAGERFIASSEFLWLRDVATILRDNLGAKAAKVPVSRVPDWLVRVIATWDRTLSTVVVGLSHRSDFSAAKAERILGWKPRPAREAVLDCANSLIALKLV